MMAGLDITVFEIKDWNAFLKRHDMTAGPIRHVSGWLWHFADKGTIVTSHNPYTGFHFNEILTNPSDRGTLGYVGIQGKESFVEKTFNEMKENSSYYKDWCWGKRSYI